MRVGLNKRLGLVLAIGLGAAGFSLAACKETPPKAGDAKSTGASGAGDTKVADAKPTPPPAPAPKPVAEAPPAPTPAPPPPAPAPVAEVPPAPTPAPPPPAPTPKPVAEVPPAPTPAPPPPAPAPKPVAEVPPAPTPAPPPPAPAPTPVAEVPPAPTPAPPPPAPAPTPVAEAPAPTPAPPSPAPAPKPVAEVPPAPPPPAPEPKPVAEAPTPAPVPTPPAPEPKPVAETPAPAPTPAPTPTTGGKAKYQAKFNGKAVKSWAIQLQNPDPDVIARTPYDVVAIDYSRDASHEGRFTREDVARMKRKPDGSERVVIAYMSIGEIEDYRYYWQQNGWQTKSKRPSWIGAENPEWLQNYTVKFWSQGWKDIIYAKPDSYLDRIIDAGFDGVYLDKIDIIDVLEDQVPKGANAFNLMVEFLQGIRAKADKRKPGFLMVASNAEAALDDDDYRATMNAIGKEDLYFNSRFNAKTGKLIDGYPNDSDAIKEQVRLLQKLIDDDKVVLSVEYIDSKPELIQPTAKKLAAAGYVPYFGPRDLARLSGFTYAQAARIAARGGEPSLAASVRKAAQCTGMPEDACGKESRCIWITGYRIDDATTVPGYCRIAPLDTTNRLNIEARD